MKPVPGMFPVDLEGWSTLFRGSGEEVQSWTCGKDVGRGVVALCGADEWVCWTFLDVCETSFSWPFDVFAC